MTDPSIRLNGKPPRRSLNHNWLNRLAKFLLHQVLRQIKDGELIFTGLEKQSFGRKTGSFPEPVTLEIRRPAFYGQSVFGGSVGTAESYMAGDWSASDLTRLIRLMIRNRSVVQQIDGGISILTAPLRLLTHWMNRNTQRGSRRNIVAHYDLGNDFFRTFLDPTMMYSCALFEPEELTLEQASIAKLDRICQLLDLKPEDRILEIGTGWGGFALHAAQHYGCHVTTTTISDNQLALASRRIQEAGLEDRITLLKKDYRKLTGTYDKLVSIEMIEAVGHQFFETFFKQCATLLKPDGLMLLQTITINDRQYLSARDEVDFIKRYIFPGSCIPAIQPLIEAAAKGSDLQLVYTRDIGRHYATTLRIWRENFFRNLDAVKKLGYSETFIRLWEYYLCYCEAGFEERALGDHHMLFQKPLYRGRIPA